MCAGRGQNSFLFCPETDNFFRGKRQIYKIPLYFQALKCYHNLRLNPTINKRRYFILNNRNKHSDPDSQLYSAILKLQTVEECYDFFTDLCTFSELKAMEQRFELAKLLNDGLIYNDILEKTGASSATISRVNRTSQLRHGRLPHHLRPHEGRGAEAAGGAAGVSAYEVACRLLRRADLRYPIRKDADLF